jgi:tetratricopeptide (TPR) repeat protein
MKSLSPVRSAPPAALLVVLSLALSVDRARTQDEPPPASALPAASAQKPMYEQATAEAWAAFKAGRDEEAIARADACISRFQRAADRIQSILETDKETLPVGQVSASDRKRIGTYQILNDVATCLLLKGWAEEKLGRLEEAKTAYIQAQCYTYARALDTEGNSFWSPSDVAAERVKKLPKTPDT